MAKEICEANPNAVVIADGVKGNDRVLTFQSAKGVNGLEEKDIYIILTNLAPAKYEELNVLGQWLEMPDIIQTYYQDQINQAVGRNRGFRQSTNETDPDRRDHGKALLRMGDQGPRSELTGSALSL